MTDPIELTARLQRALGDRYTIQREIGGGGMSRLFLATEPSLGREVVVKLLPPELASEVSAARFQREIELAARFQHPNIVPVLAGGASDGLLYYVMPFVRGESLRHLLKSGQTISVASALSIIDEIGDALTYAHAEGVVHRDIKPENILLAAGHAMVTDFGVARAVAAARSGEPLTGTGIAVGSPGYMAPEQLAGGTVDTRTDQYALGTLAYELLSGAPPFIAPSVQGLVVAHMTEVPRVLTERRPDVPAHVATAVARALAKNPDMRFPDVDAFRTALKVGDSSDATRARKRRRPVGIPLAIVTALALVAVVLKFAKQGEAAGLDENLIAVAPFAVLDPSLEIWREGLVDVLSRAAQAARQARGLSRHDSLLVRAAALSSEAVAAPPTAIDLNAFLHPAALLKEAVRLYPQSQDAAMAYADDVFHFGAPAFPGNELEIRALFDRAIEIDSAFTPAYLHPILLSLALRDTAGALRYARAHLARDPSDEDADAAFALAQILSSPRRAETFAAWMDTASLPLLRQVSQLVRSWPDEGESAVQISTRYFERLQRSTPRREASPTESRIRAMNLAFRGHLLDAVTFVPATLRERGVLRFVGGDASALELALLGAIPTPVADTLLRNLTGERIGVWSGYVGIPYFAMRRDTLALRRIGMRIDSLGRASPEAASLVRVLGGGARGYLALSRGDSTTALREFGTMPDSLILCAGCHVWRLTHAQLLARAGRWRDAEVILRSLPNYWATPIGVLWTLERARVQEQLGDLAAARDSYAYVVAAWQNPDESLKVYVAEAQRGLTRLSSDASRSR